jgi:5'-3' exonuclease
MNVHLVDGTYELFRHFYAVPSVLDTDGHEVGAVRGVISSLLAMLGDGATHVGVATDHVIESFRNELWAGYKTGEGVDPELLSQFPLLEEAVAALGIAVWPMVELEADDALASAAARAAANHGVERVFICTPDKDLGQCVVGDRVVQLDRRRRSLRDAAGVKAKFGVRPTSIPDYLALVGDAADGFPGLPGWGGKSAAAVLGRYEHLEKIPAEWKGWDVTVRGAERLAGSLASHWDLAVLFRQLATLRTDAVVFRSVGELEWGGPQPEFTDLCLRLKAEELARRARALAMRRVRHS